MTSSSDNSRLKTTPLHALHLALGAKWCPSPAMDMAGAISDRHPDRSIFIAAQRQGCSMSRIWASCALTGRNVAQALEALVPADIAALEPMRQRYTQFTDESGGIPSTI